MAEISIRVRFLIFIPISHIKDADDVIRREDLKDKTMAKAKTTAKKAVKKTAKKVEKTVETTESRIARARIIARKGALAYVGIYGLAYERAQMRFGQLKNSTDGLFDNLVERGEDLEAKASETIKGTRSAVTERFEEGTEKVKSFLPASANDRVEELQTEIEALNKKIVALGKKAKTSAKSKLKTEKTEKAA